jgi:DNA-binding CsgD family transcriptional regulator/MFS family permease
MDTQTGAVAEIISPENVTQLERHRRLEKRWYWIAFLAILNFFCVGIAVAFTAMTLGYPTPDDMDPLYSLYYDLAEVIGVITLLLGPIILRRLGVLRDSPKFTRVMAVLAVFAALSIAAYQAYMMITSASAYTLPSFVLGGLATLTPGAIAGCVLYRAVKVISLKPAALMGGFICLTVVVITLAGNVVVAVFAQTVDTLWRVPAFFNAVSVLLYVIFVALLVTTKDDFSYESPKPPALLADSLFVKFMILAVAIAILDVFSDASYYEQAENNAIYNFVFIIMPIAGIALVSALIRRNRWMPALTAGLFLFCFIHGMSIFITESAVLGYAYGLSSMFLDSCNIVFLLFVPMVFCIQRRSTPAAFIGVVAFWSLISSLGEFETAINYLFPPGTENFPSIVVPALSFTLSLAAIAFMFYLHSENNRVYVAALIAEFKAREITDVREAVSAADKLENLGLTPREKEVCALLLKSLSIKQISGELGLAFATVNGYYRSLYRKLGINSKGELFMRFGAEIPEETSAVG